MVTSVLEEKRLSSRDSVDVTVYGVQRQVGYTVDRLRSCTDLVCRCIFNEEVKKL